MHTASSITANLQLQLSLSLSLIINYRQQQQQPMAGKGPVESSSSSLPSNNTTKKIIRFQGHDMRFFELEEEVAMGKLKTYFSKEGTDSNDADDDAVVPLPFDSEVIYQVLEYCKEPSAATPSSISR